MTETKCSVCRVSLEADQMQGDTCRWCTTKAKFSAFAEKCGLTRYPDPDGERYVYGLDGRVTGKKIEEEDFIDELWNALVRMAGGDCTI